MTARAPSPAYLDKILKACNQAGFGVGALEFSPSGIVRAISNAHCAPSERFRPVEDALAELQGEGDQDSKGSQK